MTNEFELKFNKIISSLLILSVILSLLLVVKSASAGYSHTVSKAGFLSGVTAYGKVRSFQAPETSNGYCEISSYTSSSTTINVIGWTWRQCDMLYNGTVVDSRNYGGYAPSGSSNTASTTWLYAFAYGNGMKSHGNHDFNHNNSNPSPWRPYNANVYP